MSDTATNPVADAEASAPEVERDAAPEVETFDAEGEDTEQVDPPDDTEEIEYDGAKHRIPKALKDAFLMQGDYTRKTQSLAEERRALDAAKEAVAQDRKAHEEELDQRAELKAVKAQHKQYADFLKENMNALMQTPEGVAQAQQYQWTHQQLGEQARELESQISQKAQARALKGQQETAKSIEEARDKLAQIVPGWQPGNELDTKLTSYGLKNGFTTGQLAKIAIETPSAIATLNKARQWDEHQASLKAAKRAAVQEEAKPVAQVGTKASAAKDPERMSTDEWMAYERQRLAKKATASR